MDDPYIIQEATEEATQVTEAEPSTQTMFDPRRLGRNHSGLCASDISDVLCILHPSSPAAFDIVTSTARINPQHVLQNHGMSLLAYEDSQADITEQETILYESRIADKAQDLALRFSSRVNDPAKGFCFGRNRQQCDILLDVTREQKRVSNLHFRIYINSNGVVMLEDMSRNGTMVDDVTLKGKVNGHVNSRMLTAGSIIQILSLNGDETIKFIVRIPPRDGHHEEHIAKFKAYMEHVAIAEQRALATKKGPPMPAAAARGHLAAPLVGPPNPKSITVNPPFAKSNYGMHWNGGDEYNVVGLLGKGAFATVYQLATKEGGDLYAVKELEKRRFMKNGILDVRLDNEMQIMKDLKHQNIVRYIDYVEDDLHLYIVMEYVAGGDLQGYMQAHGTLSEPLAKDMTRQILSALAYLHKKNITHRDIKPDNILIASEDPFKVKLTDFGLSKVIKNNDTFLKTFCGTLLYCAPEVFPHYDNYVARLRPKRRRRGSGPQAQHRSYGQTVDIWSYAAVLWFVLCGKPPIEGVVDHTGRAMFSKIMETKLDVRPLREQDISDDGIDLLCAMLNTDPSIRPSESECLRHPWLNEGSAPEKFDRKIGLGIISEQDEDLDASQLSLDDSEDQSCTGISGEQDSQGSTGLRKSKRFKREEPQFSRHRALDSSSDFSDLSVPLINDVPDAQWPLPPSNRPNKLFGEITPIGLKSSGASAILPNGESQFNGHRGLEVSQFGDSFMHNSTLNVADDMKASQASHQDPNNLRPQYSQHSQDWHVDSQISADKSGLAASSLLGAESLVRDLNMESPGSSSREPAADPCITPKTPNQFSDPSVGYLDGSRFSSEDDDKTPKQRTYSRIISLDTPKHPYPLRFPSREVDDAEESNEPGITDDQAAPSLPATEVGSYEGSTEPQQETWDDFNGLDHSRNVNGVQHGQENVPLHQPVLGPPEPLKDAISVNCQPDFLKTPPHLGKLVSTTDSFTTLTLPITERFTTWGRNPNNSLVYPDPQDTRIPKCAVELCFHAKGIEQVLASSDDWTKQRGLHTVLRTHGTKGIWVNGVHLTQRDADGRVLYGQVMTGDEVVVSCKEDGTRLAFNLEIYHGEGANERAPGEPRFVVQRFEGQEK